MAKTYLFAHNLKNYVKTGDTVKAYDENIGSIGTAGGKYYAHLHISLSENLSASQLKSYIVNWSKDRVTKYYQKPDCDYYRLFGIKMDVGKAGYDWLQWIGNGYHPGLDINGTGGGNTDLGYKFKCPVNGKVIFAGDWGSGWGNVILISETETMSETKPYIKSDLRNTLKKWNGGFDHEEAEDHEKMSDILEEYRIEVRQNEIDSNTKIYNLTADNESKKKLVDKLNGIIDEAESCPSEIKDGKPWLWTGEVFVEYVQLPQLEEKRSLGYHLKKIWEIISPITKITKK